MDYWLSCPLIWTAIDTIDYCYTPSGHYIFQNTTKGCNSIFYAIYSKQSLPYSMDCIWVMWWDFKCLSVHSIYAVIVYIKRKNWEICAVFFMYKFLEKKSVIHLRCFLNSQPTCSFRTVCCALLLFCMKAWTGSVLKISLRADSYTLSFTKRAINCLTSSCTFLFTGRCLQKKISIYC